jgi:long-chain acyl-CoA synthetase
MIITHLSRLIHEQAAAVADKVAFYHRDDRSKTWIPTKWREFSAKVMTLAKAFASHGLREQECVATFTQNRPEGLIVDFAAYANRAIAVPIYATSSEKQVAYILKDSAAKIIFAGEQFQYDNARLAIEELEVKPLLVVFDASVKLAEGDTTTRFFADFIADGEKADTQALVEARMKAADNDDLANLIYTSGTTGEPKGVMIPQGNYITVFEAHHARLNIDERDSSMCFLPTAHIFERAWTYFCLSKNMVVYINHNPLEVQQSLRETQPTMMCAVPRFWEKVYAAVWAKHDRSKGIVRALMDGAFEVGRVYHLDYLREGKRPPLGVRLRYAFYDKMVLSKIRLVAGVNRGRLFPCAGAALSPKICEFLRSIGIPIVVGYGLTETTATVCCFPDTHYETNTMGTCIPGVEVKIGDQNEILVKGGNLMRGYYNKPEETAKAFTEDGWFRTGDIGAVTPNGGVQLTDRLKDLFKTANGKYVAPQALETAIAQDAFIEQIAVIGNQRKFVSALIVPAYDEVKHFAETRGIAFKTIEELLAHPDVIALFEERINEQQKEFAAYEQVKKFRLLPKPFGIATGELTNTLKVKRSAVNERYKELIDEMYREAEMKK